MDTFDTNMDTFLKKHELLIIKECSLELLSHLIHTAHPKDENITKTESNTYYMIEAQQEGTLWTAYVEFWDHHSFPGCSGDSDSLPICAVVRENQLVLMQIHPDWTETSLKTKFLNKLEEEIKNLDNISEFQK